MSNISNFKGQLTGGGARANLFKVNMQFPTGVVADVVNLEYMVKGASLPASTVGVIEVPYRGRKLKIAGDRTFETWTITVINDTNMSLRNAFEDWMSIISANEQNITYANPPLSYTQNMTVSQLDRYAIVTKTYEFIDAFPLSVSTIDLNYETNDAVEEFTVEFAYQYWINGPTQ